MVCGQLARDQDLGRDEAGDGNRRAVLACSRRGACCPDNRRRFLRQISFYSDPELPELYALDQAAALMKPANESALMERAVSKAIGNVRNNGPDLLAAPG